MLEVGHAAPHFRLESSAGGVRDLKELRGKKIVLYFYPKDDTPGCTREACDFRDSMDSIRGTGAVVIGVSKDSVSSHDRFKSKYSLPFELLSDPDNKVATAYGAFGQKTLYGQTFMGTIRSTFVIDEEGKVAARWSPVKVDGHVETVLDSLSGEGAGEAAGPGRTTAPKKSDKAAKKAPAKKAAKKAPAKKAAKKAPAKKAKKKR